MIFNGHSTNDIAAVAYEAVAALQSVYAGAEWEPWYSLVPEAQQKFVDAVELLVTQPHISERAWHDAQVTAGLASESYDELDDIARLRVRLWRHVVQAFYA